MISTDNRIQYGRVSPVRFRFGARMGRERASLNMVTVAWWINDRMIPYYVAENKPYLMFFTEDGEHRVYNPQILKFDLNKLVSVIRTECATWLTPASNFQVVDNEKVNQVNVSKLIQTRSNKVEY